MHILSLNNETINTHWLPPTLFFQHLIFCLHIGKCAAAQILTQNKMALPSSQFSVSDQCSLFNKEQARDVCHQTVIKSAAALQQSEELLCAAVQAPLPDNCSSLGSRQEQLINNLLFTNDWHTATWGEIIIAPLFLISVSFAVDLGNHHLHCPCPQTETLRELISNF